jgi:hypothetical protein
MKRIGVLYSGYVCEVYVRVDVLMCVLATCEGSLKNLSNDDEEFLHRGRRATI